MIDLIFRNRKSLFAVFILWAQQVVASSPAAVRQELIYAQNYANFLFESLFDTINKTPKRDIDYVKIIGNRDDPSDQHPVSMRSRFRHFCKLTAEYSDLDIPLVQAMTAIIGTRLDPEDAPTLCNVLRSLAKNIPCDFYDAHKNANLYFLGSIQDRPENVPISATLPDSIDALFSFFWNPWRERFIYSPDAPAGNIFALLNELKAAVEDEANADRVAFVSSNAQMSPIGSVTSPKNDTLFGKAILAQKIIGTIIHSRIPISYSNFDRLIMREPDSISSTIFETIRYIRGETSQPPTRTIASQLNEIHESWKAFLNAQLMGSVTSETMITNSLHNCLQRISLVLSSKELTYEGEQLSLVKQLKKQLSCAYINGGVFASIAILSQILRDSDTIIDHQKFSEWTRFLGHPCDCMKTGTPPSDETLFGLFNLILELISQKNTPVESLQRAIDLIGQKSDLYEITRGERTFWGLINRLFFLNFEFVNEIRDQVRDASVGLNFDYMPLLMRTDRMFMDLQFLIESKQFDWADVIISSLHKNTPVFIDYLRQYVREGTSSHAHKAFWSDSEAVGTLNIMVSSILGGGVRRIFAEPANEQLMVQSLEWYLEQINKLCLKPHIKGAPLFQLIGEPSDSVLKKTLTLNDRFQYLKEIVWNIFTFEYSHQEWYELANSFHELFKELYTRIDELSMRPSEDNFQRAYQALGTVDAYPGGESVFSMINLLFHKASSTLFAIILDKYQVSKFGLSIDTSHSLRKSLQRMKDSIVKTQTLDITTEIDLIGEAQHNPFVPSVFGRVAACEDALLQMWDGAYYIPVYQILSLAAQFYEIAHDAMTQGWTMDTLQKIGSPISSIDDISLFGTLNAVVASCLTSPLGHNVKYIATMVPEIIERLLKHPGMTDTAKISILSILIPASTLQEQFPDEEIPEQNHLPLALFEQKLSEFFYPIAGFFRFYQAKQLWDIEQKIKQIIENVASCLIETEQKFYSSFEVVSADTVQYLLTLLGNPGDITDWAGNVQASRGASAYEHAAGPVSVFGLSNRLNMRLHIIYSTLKQWVSYPAFSQCFDFLNQVKQQFYPGSCDLYYVTDALFHTDQSILKINSAIRLILNEAPEELEASPEFAEKKKQCFDEIEQDLQKIGKTNASIAAILPHVLGSHFYEILRCASVSEYIVDSIDEFSKLSADVLELVRLLGYNVPEYESELPLNTGNCESFFQVWNCLAEHTRDTSKMIFEINSSPHIWTRFASNDAIGSWSQINRLQLALQSLCPSSIGSDLRSQKVTHRRLYCLPCQIPAAQMENIHENVKEISLNLSHLAKAIVSLSEHTPLRSVIFALTGGDPTLVLERYCDLPALLGTIPNIETNLSSAMNVAGLVFNPEFA
ncbi:MAG: hypothetical protein LBF66_01260 [Holosporales bacterium]|nr:hypothetical protein [Holosporales bacterium]